MTGSTAAFGQMLESNTVASEQTAITQVTKPIQPISSPVVITEDAYSGPVKISQVATGPIARTLTPELGSLEWMAQEKAEKDKLKSDAEIKQEELEAEITRLEKVASDTKNLNKAIALTKKYVGKTWYALGGSTPDAWDCSGLVLWLYGHLDITLYHSASVQKDSGEFVTEPKIGDIVAFTYKGSSRAFHTAIYTGPDEMLHSGGKRGDRTEITSIARWAKGNGNVEVTYTRLIETNN
jgi:D-gamma-glutamyl-meso-diaminopimelic acid endopeptidase CwlS/peptidoglycan endopeptidase LytE